MSENLREDPDRSAVTRRLLSRKDSVVWEACRDAAAMRDGEALVLGALEQAESASTRSSLLWALRLFPNTEQGTQALRDAPFTARPASRAERIDAVETLALRAGEAATRELGEVVTSNLHAEVKWTAVQMLAEMGDASAWDAVFSWLDKQLRKPKRVGSVPCELGVALTYLLKERPVPDERLQRIAELVRRRWDRLHGNEREWIRNHWPQVLSEATQDSLPAYDTLRQWLQTPSLWELTFP